MRNYFTTQQDQLHFALLCKLCKFNAKITTSAMFRNRETDTDERKRFSGNHTGITGLTQKT